MEKLVKCLLCDYSSKTLGTHLKSHGLNAKKYKEAYGGEVISEELKYKYSSWQKGKDKKPLSDTTKEKLSKSMSGRKLSEDHKKKISSKHIGVKRKPLSEDTKLSISHKHRGRKLSKEWRNKISIANTGKKMSTQTKDKIARGMSNYLSNRGSFQSNLEVICKDLLEELGVKYECQYQIDRFIFDFKLEGINKYIECNGYYWHAHPHRYKGKDLTDAQVRRVRSDKRKSELIGEDNILWLWEEDLNKRREMCRQLITSFIHNEDIELNSYQFPRKAVKV